MFRPPNLNAAQPSGFVLNQSLEQPKLLIVFELAIAQHREDKSMDNIAGFKATLEANLTELEARLNRIERDLDEPLDPDSSERAVQMEDDDSLEGQARLVTREISSTKRALDRIEAGDFGVCVQCGEDISEGRMNARPEAALCIKCAKKG